MASQPENRDGPLIWPVDEATAAAEAKRVHEERLDLHEAIGAAMVTWQYVERCVFNVFMAVSRIPDEDIASAIFYSPNDFSEKLKCTHNAARLALKGEANAALLLTWGILRRRLINASEVRNALAHFTLVLEAFVQYENEYARPSPYMRPNWGDMNEPFRDRKPAVKDLNAKSIRKHTAEFHTLNRDVDKFVEQIPPP